MEKRRPFSSLPQFAILIGTVLAIGLSSELRASLEVGDLIRVGDAPGGPGGMFQIDDLNDDPEWNFNSFCAEPLEEVNFSTTYLVQGITLMTDTSNVPLTSFAAWLYNSFLDDTLTSFNADDPYDVNTLQFAIWKALEYTKETITEATENATWYTDYDARLITKGWEADYAADANWSGTGDVYVVNLRTIGPDGQPDGYAQDQLVRMPSPVPEPMSLAIWSSFALVAGLAVRAHRRSAICAD